jgi:putative ABC transport system substrate-binding protein
LPQWEPLNGLLRNIQRTSETSRQSKFLLPEFGVWKNSMSKKIFVWLLATVLLTTTLPAYAQQPTQVPRIGFLNAASASAILVRYEAFRQGLRELGYVEGKNIVIDYRYAEGKLDRLRELAAELVRLKVDVIVTAGPSATRSAKEATVTIPIVMAFDYDPVGSGAITNLARPGGNITGFSPVSGNERKTTRAAEGNRS